MDCFKRVMTVSVLWLLFCLPVGLIGPTADAYILKGEHALQLMIEHNNLPVRLFVRQQHTFWDSDIDSVNAQYDEWARYQIPGKFRSDIDADNLKKIQVVTPDQSLTIIDGKIASQKESWVDHYKDLFDYRSRQDLVEDLERLGINFSVTSLGRYNGLICYVIGAEYPDESEPQIWIEKDTFQPVRWIFGVFTTQGVVEKREILYGDWNSYYKSRYPSQIKFYINQRLVQSISVQQVEINPPFSGELFDIEQLTEAYAPAPAEEKPADRQSDVEKRIEEFKKIYE